MTVESDNGCGGVDIRFSFGRKGCEIKIIDIFGSYDQILTVSSGVVSLCDDVTPDDVCENVYLYLPACSTLSQSTFIFTTSADGLSTTV